jgi:predicted Na+-dependent transporter
MSIELDIKAILSSYAQLTLFVLMLSIGLSQGFNNLSLLLRKRSLLIRCLLASFVLVPIAAMVINQIFPLDFPIRIGLATMAICVVSMGANSGNIRSFSPLRSVA